MLICAKRNLGCVNLSAKFHLKFTREVNSAARALAETKRPRWPLRVLQYNDHRRQGASLQFYDRTRAEEESLSNLLVLKGKRQQTVEVVLQQNTCSRTRLAENVSVFRYVMTSAYAQKAKLTVNGFFSRFLSLKFHKIWQIGNQYFSLGAARFPGICILPDFPQRQKTQICKKSKTTGCLYEPYFFELKTLPISRMYCENCRIFHQRKFKKITNEW